MGKAIDCLCRSKQIVEIQEITIYSKKPLVNGKRAAGGSTGGGNYQYCDKLSTY